MILQQNRVRPITLLFEVRFRNNFTEIINIIRRSVGCNIWAITLKVKVKTVLFATTFDKILLCVQYLFGEHYPVPTSSCLNLL